MNPTESAETGFGPEEILYERSTSFVVLREHPGGEGRKKKSVAYSEVRTRRRTKDEDFQYC